MANLERFRRAVLQVSNDARGTPAADRIFVQRVEMQSRLPLLLVLRQQRKGDDRAGCEEIDRLAALHREPPSCPDGGRTITAASIHSQDRGLRGQEGFPRLPADERTSD